MNIFVGNLNFHTTEEELVELFSAFGEVSSAKIITDKFTGRSRGFAFVEMSQDEQAENAINELNGSEFKTRSIVVNEAKPLDNNNRFEKKRY